MNNKHVHVVQYYFRREKKEHTYQTLKRCDSTATKDKGGNAAFSTATEDKGGDYDDVDGMNQNEDENGVKLIE